MLCHTPTTSVFAKVSTTPLTTAFLRREIRMYTLIHGSFLPRVIAWDDDPTEPILIIEDLSTQLWPPPWDAQRVDRVLEQIHAMHTTKANVEPFAVVHGERMPGWHSVAADPQPFLALGLASEQWLQTALPLLLTYEAQCPTDGECLAHWDLRSDNMCITATQAVFVDWNLACLSNPRLDLGFWLPSLAYEGGPPPEQILSDAPDVAAWVSGFFAACAGLPQVPDAPRVRLVQQQQLETALPWVVKALDLPPPRP
jgi:thiamine kinase-like enzyme